MVSERGCLLELSQAGRAKCNAQDKQCLKCSGELCNNQGRSDFQCIQCTGAEVSLSTFAQTASNADNAFFPHRIPSATPLPAA